MTVIRQPLLPFLIYISLGVALAACGSPIETSSNGVDKQRAGSAEEEALYRLRFEAMQQGTSRGGGLTQYDPVETVPGASVPTAFSMAQPGTLSSGALSRAAAYAQERNSSAFIVWRNGKIEHEAYFDGFEQDTLIVSGSLAKPVTAILVGRALIEGHIASVDQPVADFITEWRDDAQRSQILIRHLLDMRSGLLPQALARDADSILLRAYLHPRHDEIIIHEYPVTHPAGTRYEYSNANSQLIAPLIERASGVRYARYIGEMLLQPLGAQGGKVWVNREGGTAHSGCCLMLPARSWLSIGILLINDGVWEGVRLLPEGYVAEMRTPTMENPHHGMGVWVAGEYVEWRGSLHPSMEVGRTFHSEPYLDKDLFLFDGNANQVVYMIPSENMVILRTGGDTPADKPWDNSFLPNLLIRDANRSED
ncbi:MAG: serine hydrolase [Gammaproteobacteria bacterium]|nr:serine hydrolase [Gammaproteobacteria bacterium]